MERTPGGRKRQNKETNCIRVSTQEREADNDNHNNTNTFKKNLPPKVATAQIQKALSNTEWLVELENNTKLVGPRFGVVVHQTPTEDLLSLHDDEARINKVMEENDIESQGS
ncbi:hypothetical protein EIK77_003635 [Talaromyces pinophilus]|nr:hypothetical protein EIK77_003635 [Talaromyces pinophilus]